MGLGCPDFRSFNWVWRLGFPRAAEGARFRNRKPSNHLVQFLLGDSVLPWHAEFLFLQSYPTVIATTSSGLDKPGAGAIRAVPRGKKCAS